MIKTQRAKRLILRIAAAAPVILGPAAGAAQVYPTRPINVIVPFGADWSSAAPDAFLSGSAWNWGPYYVKALEGILAHKFEPVRYLGSLADGVVVLLPYGPAVSDDAKQAVETAKKKIISGELKVFAGPIEDNEGKVRIPAGASLSSEDAATKMDWLVAGVKGSIK